MLTFREFKEFSDKQSHKNALEVVRKGMNLQGTGDFWDDFLSLCGDPEGMSSLLGTSKEKITGLGGKIRGLISEVKEKDSETKKRDKIIKTGDKT